MARYYRMGKTAPVTRRSGAISDARIASGVDGGKVAAGTIATITLADGAVTTNKVADYAILAAKIAAGQIVDSHVATGANINGNKLLNLSVTDAQIAAGITGSKVSGALTGATLAASALTAGVIPAGATINNGNWSGTALSNANLASGIDAAKLTTGTLPLGRLVGITTGQLSATAGIVSAQISDLDGAKLTGSVYGGLLQSGTVPDAALSSISGARLFGSVDGSLLSAGTVANGSLASGIDAAKLTVGTLPNGRLSAIPASALAGGITSAQISDLAATKVTAGVLASGVTINDGNWSGTALTDGHLGSGLTGSKISGALSNATLAGSALTTGAIPAGATINNGNWSGTALANANIAAGIDPSKLTGSGAVPLAAISGITPTQLATSLKQAFKARATKVSTLTNDGTLNPWNSEQLDNQNVFSAGTFTPGAATFGLIHVVLQLRGSLITPGCRGYIYMLEAGVTVAVGAWADAKTSGDTLLQPEIIAEFRTTFGFSAATAYTFAARVIDADGNAVANQLIADERLASPTAWSAGKAVVVGDHIRPSSTNGHGYRCTTAGTTSAAGHEPVFATGDYSTTNDNNNGGTSTVVWTEDGSTGLRIGSFIEFIPCPF